MEMPVTIFDSIKLTPLWYTIAAGIIVFVLFVFGCVFFYQYKRGEALKELFWGRVKGWTNKKIALFEIFNPINTVRFEYAHREMGDVYKFGESSTDYVPESSKKKGIFSKILNLFNNKITPVDSSLKSEVITPKSVYTINGVRTVPLFEVYPQLNKNIIKGLEALKLKEINTLEELEFMIDDPNMRNHILFDDYTFEKFYELYMASKNKYELNIRIKDVTGFMSNTFNKNFRESIQTKEFNVKMNKKQQDMGKKIGIGIFILCIVASVVIAVYRVIYG
jgi:hypothetical protein